MKTATLTLLLALSFYTCYAQVSVKRQIDLGGNGFDNLICMATTSDGGIILGGPSDSDSSGDKSQNSYRENDFWVVKLDKHWNKQWDRTFGGQRTDNLTCIIQTKDGGYLLGGNSNSMISGTKTDSSRGGEDYYLIKLDSEGNQVWDKTIGGNNWDYLWSIQQTKDGGFIIGGFSSSGISGEKTQGKVGEDDYWIVKLDSLHNIQWDETIGGTLEDQLFTVRQTFDGGYILGGFSYSDSSKQKSQNSKGSYDYWIVKTDGTGRIQWDKTFGSNSGDRFASLQQTKDSGYIILGTSDGNISGDKTENNKGYSDYWLVKITAKGKIQWDKTIGGNDGDFANSVIQTVDGGYILGGYSLSNISGDKTENSRGLEDFWTVKLTKKHTIEWDKTFGGSSGDFANALVEQSKDNYVIAGPSWSEKSGDKADSLKSTSFADFWAVNYLYKKTQLVISMSAEDQVGAVKEKTFISPNPAKNYFNIRFINQNNENIILKISDMSGRTVLQKQIQSSGTQTINLPTLQKGIYVVTLISGNNTSTQKLIVQ